MDYAISLWNTEAKCLIEFWPTSINRKFVSHLHSWSDEYHIWWIECILFTSKKWKPKVSGCKVVVNAMCKFNCVLIWRIVKADKTEEFLYFWWLSQVLYIILYLGGVCWVFPLFSIDNLFFFLHILFSNFFLFSTILTFICNKSC